MSFIQFLVNGTVFGSILALLSSGYSLVYGVGGVINLAHGAFYLLSVYMIFWFIEG
jgi:branched-chain amino acid transport system permease protein